MARRAGSIATLFDQFNARYPRRSRSSDGWIGDAAHQSRASDHNAWCGPGTVTAGDYTHDPANGMDIRRLTNEIVAIRDRRVKYLIANGLIVSGNGGPSPWTWRMYGGPNKHTKHFHLSVFCGSVGDESSPWRLPSLAGGAVPPGSPPPGAIGVLTIGSKGAKVTALQTVLNKWYRNMTPLKTDGDYGPATAARVKFFQGKAGLKMDGIAGPVTQKALSLI